MCNVQWVGAQWATGRHNVQWVLSSSRRAQQVNTGGCPPTTVTQCSIDATISSPTTQCYAMRCIVATSCNKYAIKPASVVYKRPQVIQPPSVTQLHRCYYKYKHLPYTNFYVEVLIQLRIKLLHVEVLTNFRIKLLRGAVLTIFPDKTSTLTKLIKNHQWLLKSIM